MMPSTSHVGLTTIYLKVPLSGNLVPNTGHASGSTLPTYTIVRRSYSVTRHSALSVVILRRILLLTLLPPQLRRRYFLLLSYCKRFRIAVQPKFPIGLRRRGAPRGLLPC